MSKYFNFTGRPETVNLPGLTPDQKIFMRPITQSDHELIGLELFRHNIVPISQDAKRAKMVHELYAIFGEEVGDEKADILEEFWQAADLFDRAVDAWQLQEDQRLLDIQAGAPIRPQAPRPEHTMKMRRRAIAAEIVDDLYRQSEPLRDLHIESMSYEIRQREGMARILIAGWEGFEAQFAQDKNNVIVTPEAWRALKSELGPKLTERLVYAVVAGERVDETEVGNSGSQPDTEFDQTSSLEQSAVSDASGGTSTVSSTTPAPTDGSVQITAPSSTSISNYGGNTLTSEAPLTAGQ